MGKRIAAFSEPAMAAMRAYLWPGNIRELQNCIERAVIVAKGPSVELTDLPAYLHAHPYVNGAKTEPMGSFPPGFVLDQELEVVERDLILRAFEQTGGVQVRAAELLGTNERSLWHRVKKLGIRIVKQGQ
jgi:DNA-binding NtrC family response regulator